MKKIIIIMVIAIIICGGVGFYKYNVNDEINNVNDEINTEMFDTVVDSIKSASEIDIENNNNNDELKTGLNKPKKNVVTKDLIDDNKVEENNVDNIIEEPEVEGEVIEESTVVENNSSNAVENNIVEEPKHEHSYSYWYEDVDGLTHTEYYKCSCGDYYTNVWTETVKEEPNNSTTNEVKTEPVKEEPKVEQPKQESKEQPKKEESKPVEQPKQEEPKHEHSWEPVYKTVHHDAEYKTVHHDAEYETQVVDSEPIYDIVCSCGEMMNGRNWDYDHHDVLLQEVCPETGGLTYLQAWQSMDDDVYNAFCKYWTHGSCGPVVIDWEHIEEEVLVKEAYDEQVLVKEAYDEQVLDYYKCNCGAKK